MGSQYAHRTQYTQCTVYIVLFLLAALRLPAGNATDEPPASANLKIQGPPAGFYCGWRSIDLLLTTYSFKVSAELKPDKNSKWMSGIFDFRVDVRQLMPHCRVHRLALLPRQQLPCG